MKTPLSFLLLWGCTLAVAGAKAAELRTLHTFGPGPLYSQAPLVQGADGASYGTTQSGGQDRNGTVFKITATGQMVVLHSFLRSNNGGVNGGFPAAGLTLASDGNFYGTTPSGGRNGHGTIFRISPQGALATLHHFSSSENDYNPTKLVQGNDGYLYGTTEGMGGLYSGIAFKISLAARTLSCTAFLSGRMEETDSTAGFLAR